MRVDGGELGVAGIELWLKLEQLQRGGSFKARGMFNRMRSNAVPAAGVVIASGGNAGIAVAVAAQSLGVRCEVFVPESASAGQARQADSSSAPSSPSAAPATPTRSPRASSVKQATGALLMHAYDQREVVVGAGTLAAEVEADAGVPDRALVSVGGGGLIAGVAVVVRRPMPSSRRSSPSWRRRCTRPARPARRSTSRSRASPPTRSARAGSAPSPGTVTQRHVDASHLLKDADIRAAQLALWTELRLAVEPAAALPLAALASGTVVPKPGERVLLVICGANVDPASLATRSH